MSSLCVGYSITFVIMPGGGGEGGGDTDLNDGILKLKYCLRKPFLHNDRLNKVSETQ